MSNKYTTPQKKRRNSNQELEVPHAPKKLKPCQKFLSSKANRRLFIRTIGGCKPNAKYDRFDGPGSSGSAPVCA